MRIFSDLGSLPKHIPRARVSELVMLGLVRALLAVVDLIVVVSVGLLISSGIDAVVNKKSTLEFPFQIKIALSEASFASLMALILFIFLIKTAFILILDRRLALVVGEVSNYLSHVVMQKFMALPVVEQRQSSMKNKVVLLQSETINVFSDRLFAYVMAFGELFLIFMLSLLVFVVSPVSFLVFASAILFSALIADLLIFRGLRGAGHLYTQHNQRIVAETNSFTSLWRETRVFGLSSFWEKRLKSRRVQITGAISKILVFSGYPRHLVESVFILAMALIVFLSMLGSDLIETASSTIIALGAGARMIGSVTVVQGYVSRVNSSLGKTAELEEFLASEMKSPASPFRLTTAKKNQVEASRLEVLGSFLVDTSGERELVFSSGEPTIITGPSGSGKTAFLEVLAGLRKPEVGQIKYKLRDAGKSREDGIIGFVPQSPIIVEGSLRDNILLGRSVTEQKFVEILDVSEMSTIVSKLPYGLESQLDPASPVLSGGERQRLALARALVGSPAVLLIDELTSAISDDLGKRILRSLGNLESVVICSSHRASDVLDGFQEVKVEALGQKG